MYKKSSFWLINAPLQLQLHQRRDYHKFIPLTIPLRVSRPAHAWWLCRDSKTAVGTLSIKITVAREIDVLTELLSCKVPIAMVSVTRIRNNVPCPCDVKLRAAGQPVALRRTSSCAAIFLNSSLLVASIRHECTHLRDENCG